jgi:hypothetical protein
MPKASDIAKVQTVNVVRKTRLTRALDVAQKEAQAAEQARDAARIAEEHKIAAAAIAKVEMMENPACIQTRLWRKVTEEKREEAREDVMAAEEARVAARQAMAERARAVRNHDIKSQKIDDYGRTLRRAEARLSEILTEDDVAPPTKGSLL